MSEKSINGNVEGIKRAELDRMKAMYDLKSPVFLSCELAEAMAEYTDRIRREISVYIARDGSVADVTVGEITNVQLNDMRLVRNIDRLSGVRCVHTHPSGVARLSGEDIGALRAKRFDAMAALSVVGGRPSALGVAFVDGPEGVLTVDPEPFYEVDQEALLTMMREADDKLISATVRSVEHEKERAILVGLQGLRTGGTLDELAELARTAGAEVIGRETQRRDTPDNAYYIGRGKAEELLRRGNADDADIFVFDDELSAVQIRNLENLLGARVIDRTALILDIFAQRAQTREGKLQVELAQLKYRLPRLAGQGQSLSRQGGGIGTRGPGEKKLESDRRRIRRQVYELELQLEEIKKQRSLRRARRERNALPVAALVGYTNSGKSTLLNALSGSNVTAEDMLFATLDPVTRQVAFPDGGTLLITDTVGFIDKLPHELVDAFRSTLEEVSTADVIVHVVDASRPDFREQMDVVNGVLDSLDAGTKPAIIAYNKADRLGEHPRGDASCAYISALNGEGLDVLLDRLRTLVDSLQRAARVQIPYARGDAASFLRQRARVTSEEYTETGVVLDVIADAATLGMVKKLLDG